MEPRIEYDNPFALGRPEGIARVEKPRQEDRKRRNANHQTRRLPRKSDDDVEEREQNDLGKRIDLEA